MGVDFKAALHEFAADLAAELAPAGVPVATSPHQMNPPCVLVVPIGMSWPTLSGFDRLGRLSVNVHLITPPPGDDDSTDYMLEKGPAVAAAVGVRELSSTTYGGSQLPAMTATVQLSVTADEPEPLEE